MLLRDPLPAWLLTLCPHVATLSVRRCALAWVTPDAGRDALRAVPRQPAPAGGAAPQPHIAPLPTAPPTAPADPAAQPREPQLPALRQLRWGRNCGVRLSARAASAQAPPHPVPAQAPSWEAWPVDAGVQALQPCLRLLAALPGLQELSMESWAAPSHAEGAAWTPHEGLVSRHVTRLVLTGSCRLEDVRPEHLPGLRHILAPSAQLTDAALERLVGFRELETVEVWAVRLQRSHAAGPRCGWRRLCLSSGLHVDDLAKLPRGVGALAAAADGPAAPLRIECGEDAAGAARAAEALRLCGGPAVPHATLAAAAAAARAGRRPSFDGVLSSTLALVAALGPATHTLCLQSAPRLTPDALRALRRALPAGLERLTFQWCTFAAEAWAELLPALAGVPHVSLVFYDFMHCEAVERDLATMCERAPGAVHVSVKLPLFFVHGCPGGPAGAAEEVARLARERMRTAGHQHVRLTFG